jgi:hypothetical protein
MRIAAALAAAFALAGITAMGVSSNLREVGHATDGRMLTGPTAAVGNGTAQLYVEVGSARTPRAVGIVLTESALSGLAARMNTTSRCFDKNGDGSFAHGECLGDYQAELLPPPDAAELGIPVRWATVNWNPEGHPAPAPPVWSAPHFDFHFFLAEPGLIHAIRPGPCGEFIDCRDSARASIPLPRHHAPEGYIDVGAAVAAMGNHLIDARDPEIADPTRGFSHTFIYGAYDGRLVFLEPMVSHAYLSRRPNGCRPVRVPEEYAVAGYYPTRYCVRHDQASGTYRIALEGLTRHPAP